MNETQSPAVVEPAQQPPLEPPGEAPASGQKPAVSPWPLIIALLSLAVSIALAVGAYFVWFQVQQIGRQQAGVEVGVSDRIQPLRASLEKVQQTVHDDRTALDAKIQKLDDDQQSMSNRIGTLTALMGRGEQGWTLAETEYLLRIASQRLQLQHDTVSAEQALQAADGRLRDLADPLFLSVREQIARDLEALKAVPQVDVDGLAATLGSAIERIDALPVAGTRYQPAATPDRDESAKGATATAKNLSEFGKLIWESLSGLFRLREHDQPVGPMMAPKREYFLRENLRLQLAAARLALLRDDRAQYQAALHTAAQWLGRYFDKSDTGVQQLKATLERIAAVDINPALPDVSGSLRLLRRQMRLAEKTPPAPAGGTTPAAGAATLPAPEQSNGNGARQ